jgi:hypothetical protein
MMATKSKVYTASIAEEASADFEAHAAAEARVDLLCVECPVCQQTFSSAAARKMHVSTVVSAGCSGESPSVYAPHIFVSDLLCVCCVLLCVPTLQHNELLDFPCQLCEQRLSTKWNLKSHVLSKVSRSVCPHTCFYPICIAMCCCVSLVTARQGKESPVSAV